MLTKADVLNSAEEFKKDLYLREKEGRLPDMVIACVGGGSNSMGMFTAFLGDPLDIYGVEPLGKGPRLGDHSASITYGRKGVLHGFESIMLQDEDGNPGPVHSVASGTPICTTSAALTMSPPQTRKPWTPSSNSPVTKESFPLWKAPMLSRMP